MNASDDKAAKMSIAKGESRLIWLFVKCVR